MPRCNAAGLTYATLTGNRRAFTLDCAGCTANDKNTPTVRLHGVLTDAPTPLNLRSRNARIRNAPIKGLTGPCCFVRQPRCGLQSPRSRHNSKMCCQISTAGTSQLLVCFRRWSEGKSPEARMRHHSGQFLQTDLGSALMSYEIQDNRIDANNLGGIGS